MKRLQRTRMLRDARYGLGPTAKAVLLVIDDIDGDGQGCWASLATIAETIEVNRGTVVRAMVRLRNAGLIREAPSAGKKSGIGGVPTTARFVNWDRVQEAADRCAAHLSDRCAAHRSEGDDRCAARPLIGAQRASDRCAAHQKQQPEQQPEQQPPKARGEIRTEISDTRPTHIPTPPPDAPPAFVQATDEQVARLNALVARVEASWPNRTKRAFGRRSLQRALSGRLYDLALADWDAPGIAALAYAESPKGRGQWCQQLGNWIRDEGWLEDPESWEDDGESNGKPKPKTYAERLAYNQKLMGLET